MVLGTCSPFAHSAGPQLCLLGAGSTSPSSASLLTRVSKGSERSCMRRKMRPLANWYSQNLSPNSWGQLEPLFPAQPQQPGQMLGLFLLVLPGSSQAELPLVGGGREGERKKGLKGRWGYVVQRTALDLCLEAVKGAVLGAPASPCSWMRLFLTSDWSPYSVLICMKSLSAFYPTARMWPLPVSPGLG